MAGLRRGQSGAIARVVTLLGLSLGVPSGASAGAPTLYNTPVLTVDPGMHTAAIWAAAVDADSHVAATGSEDKTVRVWTVNNGELQRTIRVPAGPDGVGKIYAVAISPDGDLVAAGGMTGTTEHPIYLFDVHTGGMTRRITGGLPQITTYLVFSPDGRYLAAVLGRGGLRVYDRDNKWAEVFRDTAYGDRSQGAAFAVDGRLATTAFDGKIRLYDRSFAPIAVKVTTSGHQPFGIAFSPNGKVLAVGYYDTSAVDLLDAQTLTDIPGPADLPATGSLEKVAWSKDGETLFAGGIKIKNVPTEQCIFAWGQAGHGERRTIAVGHDRIKSVVPLTEHRLLVATMDPYLAVLKPEGTMDACLATLKPDGNLCWSHESQGANLRTQSESLTVSTDGTVVEFGFEQGGKSPLRFDLTNLSLRADGPADGMTRAPKHDGLAIDHWLNSSSPTLDGKPIALLPMEVSRSLTIDPDQEHFVLGTSWSLRGFDAEGKPLWLRSVPQEVWAVNVTGDGRMVVAGYADGTIRWHRMDDGRELLALMVLSDRQNWVAWTPEGFYGATPGAYGVLRWHVNHGLDAAATTVPVSAIPRLRRPDVLPHVLKELETVRALGIADLTAARRDVQVATGAANPPGARLHVLTIGINDYGDKAKHLHLDFASTDASDVFNALVNTQDSHFNKLGGLYAEVMPTYVHDEEATKEEVYEALASMQRNMARSTGEDLAVVMFSGHGAMLEGQFYLLPHGVNAATPARLEATAIPATEFQGKLAELAKYGRVLVLLDACHSGAVTGDGTRMAPNAEHLRSAFVASNVTVLTSSNAEETSREDRLWGHGAFTKALLEALAGAADANNDSLISMSELTDYLSARVPDLTEGHQHIGLAQGFQRQLFVAGTR